MVKHALLSIVSATPCTTRHGTDVSVYAHLREPRSADPRSILAPGNSPCVPTTMHTVGSSELPHCSFTTYHSKQQRVVFYFADNAGSLSCAAGRGQASHCPAEARRTWHASASADQPQGHHPRRDITSSQGHHPGHNIIALFAVRLCNVCAKGSVYHELLDACTEFTFW